MRLTDLLWLACLSGLAACADPLSSSDGIWPEAGLAQRQNMISQTLPPFSGYGANPGGAGPRAISVIQEYRTNPGKAGAAPAGSAFGTTE